MMYTFGDVRTPLPSSAQLIEQIVRKQIVDIIIQAAHTAQNVRNARSLSAEDVIFTIRRDAIKVARLQEFLSWKDLRKTARPAEDVPLEAPDEELFSIADDRRKKKTVARLPWDPISGLVAEATGLEADLLNDEGAGEEADEDIKRRLKMADIMTRDMSREEYMEYSECRQASFTYKKAKKFRDWINPAQYVDFRLNDDVVEIMGFLAWEMVRNLTEVALGMKRSEMVEAIEGNVSEEGCRLFSSPLEKTAITPEHIHAAVIKIDRACRDPYEVLLAAPLYRRRVRLF